MNRMRFQKIKMIGAAFLAALSFYMPVMEIRAEAADAGTEVPFSYTVTEIAPCYVETTEAVSVYAEPFLETQPLAEVPEHVVFIVIGITDNGWYQVRYLGQRRYLTPEHLTVYAGGARTTKLPQLDADAAYAVNFLGDSITYGDKLPAAGKSYAELLADRMGASAYHNYGLNGSCMGGEHPDRFFDRFPDMTDEADLVFVLGGTNDYEFNTPLGTMGDATTKTFYGCLNLLMCSLQQKYPDAQIVFLTPLRRNRGTKQNEDGHTLEDYVYAVINMGEFYDIPVVDLYHADGLNFVGNRRYLVDGLHPTAAGHRKIADYIFQLLFVP